MESARAGHLEACSAAELLRIEGFTLERRGRASIRTGGHLTFEGDAKQTTQAEKATALVGRHTGDLLSEFRVDVED